MGRKRAQDANSVERREKALDLRIQGYTYREIGKKLNISHGQAYKDVSYELEDASKRIGESADELLQIEIDRLDMLIKGLEPMARVGNPGAVNSYLKVMERRAKLLGLDQPVKADLTSGGEPLKVIVEYAPGNPKTS